MGVEVTTSQEYVYFGHILNLRVDTVRLADGGFARREIVEHRDAVTVVPLDAEENVLFVRQFRKPTEQELYELPAGVMDEGETSEQAAQRELSEETGFVAGKLTHLAGCYSSAGFCTEYMHIFLAQELSPMPSEPDEDEDITLEWIPLTAALGMIGTGELRDAKTFIGLLLASREK